MSKESGLTGLLVSNNLVKNVSGELLVPVGMVRLNSAWYTKEELERALNTKTKPTFVDVHHNRGKAFVARHNYEELIKLCAITNVDWIGISKVESKQEILNVQEIIKKAHQAASLRVCAKIESKNGYDNLNEIITVAEGVMVDSEDLASEVGWDDAVRISKDIYDRLSFKRYPWFRLAGVVFQYANVEPRGIVYTYGVFDMLHLGHLNVLRESKKLGNYLVVGVVKDEAVKKKKGSGRPIQDLETRMQIVKALSFVDKVVVQEDFNPAPQLEVYRPQILAKGDDWDYIPGQEWMEANGGRLVKIPYTNGHSTSSIIKKIKELGD